MKANEAPEKIYIDDPTGEFNDHWSVYQNDDSVEYTRTDAFIEKACDSYCKLCDTKECGDTGECDWVEKFRKRLMR
jgi:hypothetical protein